MTTTTKPRARKTAAAPSVPTGADLVSQASVPDAATTPIVQALTELTSEAGKVSGLVARGRELGEQYKDVAFDVGTPKGMRDAVEARKLLRQESRLPLQHMKEAVSKQFGAMRLQWNDTLQQYIDEVETYEKPIDQQIKAQETREAERKAKHESAIRDIQRQPELAIGIPSREIADKIAALELVDLAAFEEYREAAAGAQEQALHKLRVQLDQALAVEERRANEQRREQLMDKVRAIAAIIGRRAMCRTAARLQSLIDELEAVVIDVATYQEFIEQAQTAKDSGLALLRQLHAERVLAETPKPTPAPTPEPVRGEYLPREQSTGAAIFDATTQAIGDAIKTGSAGVSMGFDMGVGDFTATHVPAADMQIDGTAVFGADGTVEALKFEPPLRLREAAADPFAAQPGDELPVPSARPTDGEILQLVAQHYDVEPHIAAAWLHNFDSDAALSQQSLLPTS